MKRQVLFLPLILLVLLVGCAKAITKPREAYVLARDHGWIELSVNHGGVPAVLPETTRENRPTTPYCSISVHIDGEPYLDEIVYPKGDKPPFTVDSGFRFPVPSGEEVSLVITYSGCNQSGNDEEQKVVGKVVIPKDMTIKARFDGVELHLEGAYKDETVSLETINVKLDALLQKK